VPNILRLKFSSEQILKRGLKELYQEISNDSFKSINSDLIRMSYYGKRQGEFFRLFREHQNHSLEELSQITGITVRSILEIENGDYVPDEHITALYAEAIGATIEMNYFLDFFDDSN
jgi:DNA-binding XRE family transcriptional regulator